ncbi:MAG: poxB regulator PoxA [Gammaproteobacteria bacterium]|jgi:lysyl-tRNA synthetase class 2|nr:poxB regulator PoxA [Gammaproteobacteria bacterium]
MQDNKINWQPTASLANLKNRAQILAKIRGFFAARNVLEVETPLLSHATITDPVLHSFATCYTGPGAAQGKTFYLQTSPEFAMKRLLAADSGSIYQICKAFRNDELGRHHNPEFTMLEWYRPGFDHHDLMNEMDELLKLILAGESAERLSYQQAFLRYAKLDPHDTSISDLEACANNAGIETHHLALTDKDSWLHLLMSHVIEPQLGQDKPCFIYDYPATQAALAQIRPGNPPLAERFEVYSKGIELANGFHELSDAKEQYRRFANELEERKSLGLPLLPIDYNLLAALEHGIPDCAGVALGIDRLVMLACKAQSLQEVINFPVDRA